MITLLRRAGLSPQPDPRQTPDLPLAHRGNVTDRSVAAYERQGGPAVPAVASGDVARVAA